MKTIAFFNNKGGVGKTSLVYHLAWMFADQGHDVLAADLDPQSNLTAMFLEDEQLEELWNDDSRPNTIQDAVVPLIDITGDIQTPIVQRINSEHDFITGKIGLIAGNMDLSKFEDPLSEQWPKCLEKNAGAFRVISAFYRILAVCADEQKAELVLIDVGPNLGAINRAALIASDYVVIPLSPDLYSIQGLRNLGPTLRDWRRGWKKRLGEKPETNLNLPKGEMSPLGYVVLQHALRQDRPVKAYDRWIARIPAVYRESVLAEPAPNPPSIAEDPHCLTLIKHYRSLMPMAMEARKPMFFLKPADGAIGAHVGAVKQCYKDFEYLAQQILLHIEKAESVR
ncbi:MAG: ParA family protein [bacterium]